MGQNQGALRQQWFFIVLLSIIIFVEEYLKSELILILDKRILKQQRFFVTQND